MRFKLMSLMLTLLSLSVIMSFCAKQDAKPEGPPESKQYVPTGKISLNKGDTVFVCNCKKSCKCNTISRKPGNCACGNKLAKAKVVKLKKNTVLVKIGKKKTKSLKLKGKYACGCGKSCDCNTISNKPGKCSCGTDLVETK
ncbi:MAG: hypothetical protein OEZ36_04740 [Spirochaetota bacterium]|nr:hypothetical protein [Spirochaetota bacterium]